ncbi:MAG: phosphoribosylglycinamide formyltransferase [Halanaerobiales bacterium]
MLKIGVLVSGNGSNLQAIIDRIEAGELQAEISIVISDREDAYALKRAARHGIENMYIDPGKFREKREYEGKLVQVLKERGVELVIMAGFMRLLGPYFIREFHQRVMNIHPSLLPSFPGLRPQLQALEHGVKVSGCTVHFADEGMDTGPIILQGAVPVYDDDTEETLSARILEKEHQIYPEAIKLYSEGRLKIEGRKVRIL